MVRMLRFLLVAPLAIALLALHAPGSSPSSHRGRWDERLARLDPVRPLDYLELGEEVADAAENEAERRLARELFGLAGALDTQRLGRSAMLALAQFAANDEERARALAAAELTGGRGGTARGVRAEPAQLEALSRAISFHRRGDGRRALGALKQDGADALLDVVGEALAGGADVFREECRSMRAGGPALADADAVGRGIYVELALRQGELRSPGLDLVLEGDAPLLEIDLADPIGTWGVDPSRPWWRGGKWSGNE
ncbi:MAG: hypothetical protein RLZZ238_1714 [Planctomycetota bacterium]|jgi:hypothetical protein